MKSPVIKSKSSFVEARLKAGFSMRELARVAGISYGAVFHIEHGKSVKPSSVRKLCEALHSDFDSLFEIVSEEKTCSSKE